MRMQFVMRFQSAVLAAAMLIIGSASGSYGQGPATSVSPSPNAAGFSVEALSANDFSRLFEAVSGKPCNETTRQMLENVVAIERHDNIFRLVRSDDDFTEFGPGTEYGDRMQRSMEKTEKQARKKVSEEAGDLIRDLAKLSITSGKVELHRNGAKSLTIEIPNQNKLIPVHVKEIRLDEISLDLSERNGTPMLTNIQGIKAIVSTAGIDLPIELREFSRKRQKNGNTKLTFGITSLIPFSIRHMLQLPNVMSFSYTLKKRKNREREAGT